MSEQYMYIDISDEEVARAAEKRKKSLLLSHGFHKLMKRHAMEEDITLSRYIERAVLSYISTTQKITGMVIGAHLIITHKNKRYVLKLDEVQEIKEEVL